MNKNKSHDKSTQKHLLFKSIKEGVVVLKDGDLRVALMVNSINFNLKSNEEQEAIIASYQNFLNSLDFPIQIVVQSRVLDLNEYLNKLQKTTTAQNNELLRIQTREYVKFVSDLINVANIMSKTFYVIIPQSLVGVSGKGMLKSGQITEAKTRLLEKANLVANGLSPMGLNSALLNTEELIDLLYTTYNPDLAKKQKLFSVNTVDTDIITSLKNKPTEQ